MQGRSLPYQIAVLRAEYYNDMQFLLDSLARLGLELKNFPRKPPLLNILIAIDCYHSLIETHRGHHLRRGLEELNQLLFYRMMTQQSFSSLHTYNYNHHHNHHHPASSMAMDEDIYSPPPPSPSHLAPSSPSSSSLAYVPGYHGHESSRPPPLSPPRSHDFGSIDVNTVAAHCPHVASFSLHMPLLHSHNNVYRLLRFMEEECELLQSKDKAPYLVWVELLEEPFPVKSHALYLHRRGLRLHAPGLIIENPSPQQYIDHDSFGADVGPSDEEKEQHKSEEQAMVQLFARDDISYPEVQRLHFQENREVSRVFSVEDMRDELRLAGTRMDEKAVDGIRSDIRGGHIDGMYSDDFTATLPSSGPVPRDAPSVDYPRYPPPQPPQQPQRARRRTRRPYPPNPLLHHHNTPPAHPTTASPQYSTPVNAAPTPHDMPNSPWMQPPHLSSPLSTRSPEVPNPTNSYDDSILVPGDVCYKPLPSWHQKRQLLQARSPFGHLPGYTIKSFIVKSGDDLNKEVLALQLIHYFMKVFQEEHLDIYMKPYQILSTGYQCGLIEFLEGSMSIDKIKKTYSHKDFTLRQFFHLQFGQSYGLAYQKAVINFIRSLVGYSLFTFLIQVKDRHNANILLDAEGHILHIDFGFILGGKYCVGVDGLSN